MTNLVSRLACVLLLLGTATIAARGQDSTASPFPMDPECRRVFDDVETGIREGRPGAFAQHFGPQVQIHLRGFEGGYVSSAQAYYVLEDFFQGRRPVGVRLTTFGDTGGAPYASGSAVFNARGNRESAQIYVSLSRLQERWTVGQLNIR